MTVTILDVNWTWDDNKYYCSVEEYERLIEEYPGLTYYDIFNVLAKVKNDEIDYTEIELPDREYTMEEYAEKYGDSNIINGDITNNTIQNEDIEDEDEEAKSTNETPLDENKLIEPINFTDPYVFHDAFLEKASIAHIYRTEDITNDNKGDVTKEDVGNNGDASTLKTHGILYPLIQLNTKVIEYTQIVEMIIYYDKFLPRIELTIYDPGELIQRTDIPGYNNTLKVVIVPEVENVYKTITMEFKIMSVQSDGEYVTYFGKYKVLEFNKNHIKELIYKGCSNEKGKTDAKNSEIVKCNPNQNKQPNTWELLHIIASECGLGFSSTDKCQDIRDNLPRLIYNNNYEDFIIEQLSFGGLDENSIFDAWVDLYGYLVMINVAWVLNNTTVTPDNLGIYAFTGLHGTDSVNEPPQEAKLVHRTLNNFSQAGEFNNLGFEHFDVIVNNSGLMFGTSISMYNFGLLDINNGTNGIEQYDIDIIRDAVDDKKLEEYSVEYQEHMIIECNDLPINKQKLIREKFFEKHRQRILEIELSKLNLGLQRGTLVNVAIMETEIRNKQFILTQTSNALTVDPPSDEEKNLTPDNMTDDNNDSIKMMMDEQYELPNMGLSGMYYIDSMRFEYRYEENHIRQFLRLIKKGNLSNLSNLSTPPKINTTITQINNTSVTNVEEDNYEYTDEDLAIANEMGMSWS